MNFINLNYEFYSDSVAVGFLAFFKKGALFFKTGALFFKTGALFPSDVNFRCALQPQRCAVYCQWAHQ
jgi:hypothetical protein